MNQALQGTGPGQGYRSLGADGQGKLLDQGPHDKGRGVAGLAAQGEGRQGHGGGIHHASPGVDRGLAQQGFPQFLFLGR